MSDLQARNQTDRQLLFISDLQLPAPTPLLASAFSPLMDSGFSSPEANPPVPSAEGKDAAAVLEDSLVSFTDGLSDQNRDDVMNSLLLMQLAANKKFSKEQESEQWYKFYHGGLGQLGWLTTAHGFQSYAPVQQSFTMDQIAIEIIGLIGGASFARVAQAATKALANNQQALRVFENSNQSEEMSCFKMLPCLQTERGDVSMVLNFMSFKKTVKTKRVLFWKFSNSDVRICRGADKIQLNASVYKGLRGAVAEKLGKKGAEFISGLDI